MDPKMIEMNNLRMLNDYLTQTLEVLGRSPRLGVGAHTQAFGYSPFGGQPFGGQIPATVTGLPTDTVYGPSPWGFGGQMYQPTPFVAQHPFTGQQVYGAGYGVGYGAGYNTGFGPIDPFAAQRTFGAWQQPWGQQQPWGPISEVTRQAQFTQALAAKQSVLEAACRNCGIL